MKKNEKMLQSMALIDEKYVEEADPTKVRQKKKHPMLRGLAIGFAACFALMLTSVNLWLFIPFSTEPPDVSQYSDSEYYPIIEKLNALTYEPPEYKNNFEKLLHGNMETFYDSGIIDDSGTIMAQPSVKEESSYEEVTDNQVEGVIEGDRIKRSDEYIYYLDARDCTLRIYSINGIDTVEVSRYYIVIDNAISESIYDWEIYLSQDCKTVTVIAPYSAAVKNGSQKYTVRTQVISFDVSDPTNVSRRASVDIAGYYSASRMVDGKLLLLNEYYVGNNIDFSDESTFLPQINKGNGFESIPMENIITPETLTTSRYTVVCKIDEQTLALEDATAFLSYSVEVYVSNDSLYATHSYSVTTEEDDGYQTSVVMTEITALSYKGEQFETLGTVTVKGSVKDQYSLDEYEGILRVVTTTNYNRMRESSNGDIMSVELDRNSGTSASLYCVDINTWEIVAEVADFAPKGETVQSVRFDGDSAYVCTAVVVTLSDPVFFFDLSDLNNITYKDTGAIEGFSSSLINIGNGFLLGIGVGEQRDSLKLEVYEESENGVVSVCSYERKNVRYSTEYKSYLVDREHQLFGLGISDYDWTNISQVDYNPDRYLLFYFDGYELHVVADEPLCYFHNDVTRAVYIDDYLYMFPTEEINVVKVGLNDGE